MSTIVVVEAIDSIIDRSIDLLADTLKLIALTNTYVEAKTHQFIDEGGVADMVDARVPGTVDQTLTGKTLGKDVTGLFSYFLASNVTFVGVPGGATLGKVGLYKSTGVDTTSKIIATFDIADITTNGGDIVITWAAAASGGILKFAV